MEAFEGKWKQVKQEKAEEYLKASGVSMILRKVANSTKPVIEFKKEADGSWTYVFTSPVASGSFNFKLGEEADEKTPDGRKFKSTITVENGKLIHKMKAIKSDQKDSKLERWIEGDVLHSTAECDGVVSKYEDQRV